MGLLTKERLQAGRNAGVSCPGTKSTACSGIWRSCFSEVDKTKKNGDFEKVARKKQERGRVIKFLRVFGHASDGDTAERRKQTARTSYSPAIFLDQVSFPREEGEKKSNDWTAFRVHDSGSVEVIPLLPSQSVTMSVDEESYHGHSVVAETQGCDCARGEMELHELVATSESQHSEDIVHESKKISARRAFGRATNGIELLWKRVCLTTGIKTTQMSRKWGKSSFASFLKKVRRTTRGKWESIERLSMQKNWADARTCKGALRRLKATLRHIHVGNHRARELQNYGSETIEWYVHCTHNETEESPVANIADAMASSQTDRCRPRVTSPSLDETSWIAFDATTNGSSMETLGIIVDEHFVGYKPSLSSAVEQKDFSCASEKSLGETRRRLSDSPVPTEDTSIECSDIVEHEDHTIEKFGPYCH
eukprot:scaffold23510_cov115-Cylindrotheca_fusiformis.AAC.2